MVQSQKIGFPVWFSIKLAACIYGVPSSPYENPFNQICVHQEIANLDRANKWPKNGKITERVLCICVVLESRTKSYMGHTDPAWWHYRIKLTRPSMTEPTQITSSSPIWHLTNLPTHLSLTSLLSPTTNTNRSCHCHHLALPSPKP